MKLVNENGKEEAHRIIAHAHATGPNQLKVYLIVDPHDEPHMAVVAEATFQFDNPVVLGELVRQAANLIPRVIKQTATPPGIITAPAAMADKLKQGPQ